MCFAIPKKIKSIDNNDALMEDGTCVRLGDLKVNTGDFLLVYGNMAIEKIATNKAIASRKLIKQIEQL